VTRLTRVAAAAAGLLIATTACSHGTPAAGAAVMGTLLYAPPGAPLQLWAPPAAPTAAAPLDDAEALTATFAPDGKRIAYVNGGAATVAAVDGSGGRAVLSGVDQACGDLDWTADSARLTVTQGGKAGTVPVAGGSFTPFPTAVAGCHVIFSGDGSTIAYATGDGGITVAKADGSSAHAVPRLGADGGLTKRRSNHPMSLSADGKLLALYVQQGESSEGGDNGAGRALVANEIVNVSTGATVSLPVTGDLEQAYFLPHGGLLVRTQDKDGLKVSALSPDLKVQGTLAEPPTLTAAVLLGYAARA
jgi:TolB protein